MSEGLAPLAVWCFARQAGALTQTANGMQFAYAADWPADETPPLSQSLPLDGRFDAMAAAAFFGGLLPEGEPRRHLARPPRRQREQRLQHARDDRGRHRRGDHPTAAG
ncbi:MAG: HipA N-terminal domain-containing protein [Actinomycetota bacterium]|nr:HipA N-terminal domain-containing protein [Actinomycetota bacterium]